MKQLLIPGIGGGVPAKVLLLLSVFLPAFAEVANLNDVSCIPGRDESANIYVLNSGERVLVLRKWYSGSHGMSVSIAAVVLPPLVSTPAPPIAEPQTVEATTPRPERQVTYGEVPKGWRCVGVNVINGFQQKIIERVGHE